MKTVIESSVGTLISFEDSEIGLAWAKVEIGDKSVTVRKSELLRAIVPFSTAEELARETRKVELVERGQKLVREDLLKHNINIGDRVKLVKITKGIEAQTNLKLGDEGKVIIINRGNYIVDFGRRLGKFNNPKDDYTAWECKPEELEKVIEDDINIGDRVRLIKLTEGMKAQTDLKVGETGKVVTTNGVHYIVDFGRRLGKIKNSNDYYVGWECKPEVLEKIEEKPSLNIAGTMTVNEFVKILGKFHGGIMCDGDCEHCILGTELNGEKICHTLCNFSSIARGKKPVEHKKPPKDETITLKDGKISMNDFIKILKGYHGGKSFSCTEDCMNCTLHNKQYMGLTVCSALANISVLLNGEIKDE
jgi:hypothetical protein